MSIGSNERLQTLASCGAAALVLWVGVFALDLGCFRGVAAVLARQRQPAARAARLLGPSPSDTNSCSATLTGPTKPHSSYGSGECSCAAAVATA